MNIQKHWNSYILSPYLSENIPLFRVYVTTSLPSLPVWPFSPFLFTVRVSGECEHVDFLAITSLLTYRKLKQSFWLHHAIDHVFGAGLIKRVIILHIWWVNEDSNWLQNTVYFWICGTSDLLPDYLCPMHFSLVIIIVLWPIWFKSHPARKNECWCFPSSTRIRFTIILAWVEYTVASAIGAYVLEICSWIWYERIVTIVEFHFRVSADIFWVMLKTLNAHYFSMMLIERVVMKIYTPLWESLERDKMLRSCWTNEYHVNIYTWAERNGLLVYLFFVLVIDLLL